MKRSDFNILAEPWAITEEALNLIFNTLQSGAGPIIETGLTLDNDAALDMLPGKIVSNVNISAYTSGEIKLDIQNNIAIIPVQYSLYGFSYDRIRQQIKAAIEDSSAKSIVLKIKSPGGLVSGCKELADFIYDAGKIKNIYAYADGTMCSAAYWLGSAAKNIAAPITASIGSIGVRMLHVDWSKWNKNAGLAFTHLAAGSYKALGNEDEPLNKKAKDYFQTHLDTIYSIFVDSVATHRGVTSQEALAMADGKVFLAQEALEKGLINRIEQDFESYMSFILKKEKIMDLTTLKADHPDLYNQVIKEGEKKVTTAAEQKTAGAVKAAIERVLSIVGAVAGEDLCTKLTGVINSGATVEMVTALKGSFANGDGGDDTDTTSRQQILDGLEKVHSEGLNQQTATKPGQKSFEEQASSFSDLVND